MIYKHNRQHKLLAQKHRHYIYVSTH